jgi:hypothetical protein
VGAPRAGRPDRERQVEQENFNTSTGKRIRSFPLKNHGIEMV